MEELDPHHDVLIEEGTGVLLVEADAADLGGQVDDCVGPLFVVQPPDIFRADQVVFGKVGHEDLVVASLPKGPDQVPA